MMILYCVQGKERRAVCQFDSIHNSVFGTGCANLKKMYDPYTSLRTDRLGFWCGGGWLAGLHFLINLDISSLRRREIYTLAEEYII